MSNGQNNAIIIKKLPYISSSITGNIIYITEENQLSDDILTNFKNTKPNNSIDNNAYGSSSITPTTIIFNIPKDTIINNEIIMTYYTGIINLSDNKLTLNVNMVSDDYDDKKQKPCPAPGNVMFRMIENLTLQNKFNFTLSQMCPINNCVFENSCKTYSYPSGGFSRDSRYNENIDWHQQQQFAFRNCKFMSNPINNCTKTSCMLDCTNSCCKVTNNNNQVINLKSKLPDANNIDFSKFKKKKIKSFKQNIIGSNLNDKSTVIVGNSQELLNNLKFIKNSKYTFNDGIKNILISPNYYKHYIEIIIPKDCCMIGIGFPILIGYKLTLMENSQAISLILDSRPKDCKQDYIINLQGTNSQLYDITTRTIIGPGEPYSLYNSDAGVEKMIVINGDKCYCENVWVWKGDHWNSYSKSFTKYPNTNIECNSISQCDKFKQTNCTIHTKLGNYKPPVHKPLELVNFREKNISDPNLYTITHNMYNSESSCFNALQNRNETKEGDIFIGGGTNGRQYNCYSIRKTENPFSITNWKDSPYIESHIESKGERFLAGFNDKCCNYKDNIMNDIFFSNTVTGGCKNEHAICFANPDCDNSNYNPVGIHVIGNNNTIFASFIEHQTFCSIYWEGDNGTHLFNQGESSYTKL